MPFKPSTLIDTIDAIGKVAADAARAAGALNHSSRHAILIARSRCLRVNFLQNSARRFLPFNGSASTCRRVAESRLPRSIEPLSN